LKTKAERDSTKNADVVLSTNLYHKNDPGRFDLVVFPCLESELVASEYDIEEKVYAHVRYAAKSAEEAVVQTYSPKSPLAASLMEGNFREFLTRTLTERKAFGYPPYSKIAYVTVSERHREKAEESVARLLNKLRIAQERGRFDAAVFSDPSLLSKRADEWFGKIVVKGSGADELLESLRVEIVRNRNVRLEWK
jgi:primosomal protein N'